MCYIYYSNKRRTKYCGTDTTFVKSIFGVDLLGPNPIDSARNPSKISVFGDDIINWSNNQTPSTFSSTSYIYRDVIFLC